MILLPPKLRARLLANLARGADPVPAVKFFNPLGPRRGRQESRMKTATPLPISGSAAWSWIPSACRKLNPSAPPFGLGIATFLFEGDS